MIMLIHEVVTFRCYLVSDVKYLKKNHILFNEWQSTTMVEGRDVRTQSTRAVIQLGSLSSQPPGTFGPVFHLVGQKSQLNSGP